MTRLGLATNIRFKTRTNTTTFADATMLPLVNAKKDELASRIQQVRPEIWNIPTLDDLVADQREYAFPSDVLNNLVRLELKFSSSGDYVLAKSIDLHTYRDALQESKIVNDFDSEEPRYFIRRKAIYILSGTIAAVTNGIRLYYNSFPANLADLTDDTTDISVDPSTTTHGFPREFHELLARGVSIEYKGANNVKLSPLELKYEIDLAKQLDDFSVPNLDHEIFGALPGSSLTGDDGFSY